MRQLLLAALVAALSAIGPAAAQTSAMLGIPFTITRPAGDGPFPGVVLLHDCSGLGPGSSGAAWRWSSELTRLGYVTIWPDSFSTRGFPGGVCSEPNRGAVAPRYRVADAYAALAHLRSLPFVDARRVAVMGGSHGGSTTLASILALPVNIARGSPGFAAAVALYPSCGPRYGEWEVVHAAGPASPVTSYRGVFRPLAPTLILTGELDDWTPAEPCNQLVRAAQAAGHPMEIRIYPGAHHAFDSAAPVRHVAGRMNANAAGGRGATTGGNATAWADARIRVRDFLAAHLQATTR
ncbi:dienelactone hydrolase family protein [Phreatobacter sp.]|uniref:dienelactone hydrolase family protein n=1 Tax=Phreatobacter sp. TaxID=1966341 RepID=UPI003F709194